MQVIIQPNAGFCQGVNLAVEKAKSAAKTYGQIYTLGDIIHNNLVVNNLRKEGIISVSSIDEIPFGSVVIIRSHGVPKSIYDELDKKNIKIIDATCPSVKRIQDCVKKYSNDGWFVLIIGNASHPEVIGIQGWCKQSMVIASLDELTNLMLPTGYKKFYVVAQTTFEKEKYDIYTANIKNLIRKNDKIVEILNSICYTTKVRQNGAKKVAEQVDTVFVIGDKNSNNTLNLLKIAKKYCQNSYLITNVSDLQSVANKKTIAKLGILAGASTPKELIMEVINRMDHENKIDSIVQDEVPTNDTTNVEMNTNEAETVAVVTETPVDTDTNAEKTDEVSAEAVAEEVATIATDADNTTEAKAQDKKPAKSEEKMTMADAMKKFTVKSYREGMKLKARIVSIDPTGISVAVEGSGKNDSGFIDKDEVELDGSFNPESYEIDALLDVVIIPKTDSKMKSLNLSQKAYDAIKIEDEAVKKILEGEEFSLACNQAIKGGLLGRLGSYTIFVPASQIRMGYVKNLEEYVGKKLRLRILPPREEVATEDTATPKHRPNPKRIVASQRIILEEEKAAREEAFWEVMQVNNIIKGKVKRFTPFGAFVSIMNFDCLAHISDLSWVKINDPSEVLELNKSYDFVVIKVDRENGKVSLGYKQLQKKPYEIAAEKYHVGDIIKGKVERIKDFGAFIEIEPGIDGLVHVSEIGHKWIANANEVLKVGEEVEAKIIGFENNKITLSIKELTEPEEIVLDDEAQAERTSRNTARFSKRAESADGEKRERKPRRNDKADSNEPREWVSTSKMGATFADLFKDLDINKFDDGGEDIE